MNNNKSTLAIVIMLAVSIFSTVALVACGTSEPKDRLFELSILHGVLDLDPPIIKVEQGDTVTLSFVTDEQGMVHLHGYDEEFMVGLDETATLVFEADVTGSFNLTFHVGDVHDDKKDHDGEGEGKEGHGEDKEGHGEDKEGHGEDKEGHGEEVEEIYLGSLEVHPR